MNNKKFEKNAHIVIDWIVDYFEEIKKYPVKSLVKPREIFN